MLVQFSIVPVGTGSASVGDYVAKAVDIVAKSGLPFRLTPMGTVIEGEWDEIMKVISACHNAVLEKCERAVTSISIDDRKGRTTAITDKIASVEKRLGKNLSGQAY